MSAAVQRFDQLLRTERMHFPHPHPRPRDLRRLTLTASLLQVVDQAMAEVSAGVQHDLAQIGRLRSLASTLVGMNRAGRPRQVTRTQFENRKESKP